MPTNSNQVPMMFRAQIEGRCQLHRIDPDRNKTRDRPRQPQDAEIWTDQWTEHINSIRPTLNATIQRRDYTISWRFVTNAGQDNVIRPVIGAKGYPFYPGSSMKGAFRKACKLMEKAKRLPAGTVDRYCGTQPSKNKDETSTKPGILRFHGGYPKNDWKQNLVDIVHPQQDWQVKTQNTHSKSGGAFAQISLYKPELQFGISSTKELDQAEWQQVWQIWETALSTGIGGRVSAGYGQPTQHSGSTLYKVRLRGQGQTARLVDGSTEFRPNIFRAALRGHALRIFGGLTTADNAEHLVNQLFGGIQGTAQVGLLSMAFRQTSPEPEPSDTYKVEGDLKWLLTRTLPEEERLALQALVKHLTQFAMLLGGFGKSWRRADHSLFLSDYDAHLIGCHWQWAGKRSPANDNPVLKLDVTAQLKEISPFIDRVQKTARIWMKLQNQPDDGISSANWREAWFQENVQVWGRIADAADDSQAIEWLHGDYSKDYQEKCPKPLTIKGSTVTGKLNQIGRLWHRMYPVVLPPKPDDPEKRPRRTRCYLELLTLFPDSPQDFDRFLQFLKSNETDFEHLW